MKGDVVARTKVTLLAAVAVLVLGGCADGTHPGDAAVVGDTAISMSQLDSTVREVSAAQGEPIQPRSALQVMISSELAWQVAEQRTVEVTDAEVGAVMNQVLPDPELRGKFQANPVADDFVRSFARGQLALIKIGGASGVDDPGAQEAAQKGLQIVTEASNSIGVSVNPRFGKWSGDQIAAQSGSLSTPFQTQSPTPTPQSGG
jgi:SurA N-terminal domain